MRKQRFTTDTKEGRAAQATLPSFFLCERGILSRPHRIPEKLLRTRHLRVLVPSRDSIAVGLAPIRYSTIRQNLHADFPAVGTTSADLPGFVPRLPAIRDLTVTVRRQKDRRSSR